MKLVKNPQTQQVFLDSGCALMGFDGASYDRQDDIDSWEVVSTRDVPCGEAWLQEPGCYGANHALIRIVTCRGEEQLGNFTAGGPTIFIQNWMKDRQADGLRVSCQWLAAYDDRNAARAAAEVEW